MFCLYINQVELNDNRIPDNDKMPIMVYDTETGEITLCKHVDIKGKAAIKYGHVKIGDDLVRVHVGAEGVNIVGPRRSYRT